jgi:hypothetical protein
VYDTINWEFFRGIKLCMMDILINWRYLFFG